MWRVENLKLDLAVKMALMAPLTLFFLEMSLYHYVLVKWIHDICPKKCSPQAVPKLFLIIELPPLIIPYKKSASHLAVSFDFNF